MRILFCTKNDIFGALILNWILPQLQGHELAVLLSDKTRPAENDVRELAEEKLFERDLPVGTLFPLIDAQAGEGRLLTFGGLARRFKVDIRIARSINDAQSEALIRACAPDIIVSARFSLIFKRNILDIPRHGVYNIHPGSLPSYRGLYAPFWALLNGEDYLGCTLHKVDEGIDTGPIHSISYLPAQRRQSVFWHIERLYPLGLARLVQLLGELERGMPPALTTQDEAAAHYYRMPGSDRFDALRAAGLQLVDVDSYRALLDGFGPGFPSGTPDLLSSGMSLQWMNRRQPAAV